MDLLHICGYEDDSEEKKEIYALEGRLLDKRILKDIAWNLNMI